MMATLAISVVGAGISFFEMPTLIYKFLFLFIFYCNTRGLLEGYPPGIKTKIMLLWYPKGYLPGIRVK
jgi:hypothetical protein